MKRRSSLTLALFFFGAVSLSHFALAQLHIRSLLPAFDITQTTQAQTNTRQARTGRRIPPTRGNFDIRAGHQRSLDMPPESESTLNFTGQQQLTGQTRLRELRLKRERPSAQLKWSSLTGTPSRIWSFSEALSAPTRADVEVAARKFLKENRDLFQLDDQEVDGMRVSRRYRTEHNGLTHLTLQQQVNGIEVFQADYAIHFDREGSVIAASGELIHDIASAARAPRPTLSSADALAIAAREVHVEIEAELTLRLQPSGINAQQEFDRSAGFGDHVPAKLVYFPLSAKQVRLAWQFIVTLRDTPDVYFTLIDAERGTLLYLHNLTSYDENPLRPHGQVYTKESPRPNLPQSSNSPPVVEREDLPFHAAPYNGTTIFEVNNPHYDWWTGVNADNLVSNNTSTYLDRDSTPNQPDLPRLTVSDGNFSFPVDLTQPPTTEDNQKAAQVNLFYWINRYHDILYSFGFNEGAGNFQTNNFGLGGQGNDAILGEAQDGLGTNNANFSTMPDGRPGRVQMFLWTGTPMRDGDFDQGVIIHELTHGLSNRLVGNAGGLAGIQGGGMGEGWSDWFGLTLLAQEGDDLAGSYPVGQFVVNNYTRGIRRFPYSTNMTVNPLTFANIASDTEVHRVGEIWCNTLWEMRALLIQKYGFQEGQRQSIQLVVDGLKLTPIVPSFLDARNGIILADRINNGGANQCLLWQAFAKRGMGFTSKTDDANDSAPVESKDAAPYCSDIGIISLDKSNYVSGETLRISLGDRNAADAVALQLTSSVTGDQETISLTPEMGIPGSFNGTVRLMVGRASRGDGVLQGSVDRADEITVTYNDPNSGDGNPAQIIAKAKISREKTAFEDTIEGGNQGWIAASAWAITERRAASGKRSWTDSPDGDYPNNSNSSLTSPLLDFTGLGDVTLTIAHSYATEDRFDLCLVEYSIDDGVTWQRVAAFTGTQSNFTQSRINLRVLDGQERARIRFRLLSDSSVAADGWYIDDIRFNARTPDPAIIPPTSVPFPVITNISPAFGPPAGGTRVTISGVNFTEDETTSVTFDGVPATSVSVLGGTTITALSPPHAAGPVTVRVISRNVAAATAGGFTYYNQGSGGVTPTLTTLFPSSGSTRGGTAVMILGANFTPETEVTFGGRRGEATFINAGALRVLSPAADLSGTVEVAVSNGAAQVSLPNGFTYIAASPPSVAVQSPNGGETFFARSVININWSSSDNRALSRHRISLVRNTGGGFQPVFDIATNLPGDAQSFTWTIPANVQPISQARIRITAIDDEGSETEAFSGGDFALVRRWESSISIPASLQRLQVVSDGRFLYAIGGQTSTSNATTLTTVQRFDPSAPNPSWSSLGLTPMPTGLNGGEAVFLNGKIYIPGGAAATGLSNTHLAYDVNANTWNTVASTSPAFLYAATVDEGRGVYYRTGGIPTISGTVGVSAARSYDPNTNSWTDLPPMSTVRYGHESAMIDGKLFVVGGQGPSGGLTSGEVYDFNTGQWSPIAPLIRPRIFAVSVVGRDPSGNPVWFVIGGQDASTLEILGTEVYDVRNNRWITLDNSFLQPTLRTLSGGAELGGFFYAVGGSSIRLSGNTVFLTLTRVTERMRLDQLTPIPLDQAPVLAVPAPQVAVANTELKFTVAANDLGSGVPITITATGLPSGANFATSNATNNTVRGTFSWTPAATDTGQTYNVIFTASDGQLSDVRVVSIQVVSASPLVAVNAADFRIGPLAIDSIAAAFGTDLAVRTEAASELPLPYELAGTKLMINGVLAPLFFVSPTQINFAVPSSLDTGSATIIVSNPTGSYALGTVQIVGSAPAIFTANATGQGDAAAVSTVDGINFQPPPFDVLVNGRPNILVLFGVGIRRASASNPDDDNGVAESVEITIGGQTARVLYAGAQGTFRGLDQINVEIPASLAGQGERRVEVVVTVNGVAANRVTIPIR